MALKGTINGSTSNADIKAKIEWSATQSISSNTSSVTATLYLRRDDALTTYGSGTFAVKINGTSKSSSSYLSIGSSWVKVAIGVVNVTHNSDGTKSITISGSGSIPGTTLSSVSCSATVTLDTIPRASVPSGSAVNFGGTLSLNMNRKSSAFTHKVTIKVGSHTATKSNVATSTTFDIPEAWADAAPTSNSATIVVMTITYSGSTQLGTSTVNIAANVPTSWKPSFVAISASSDNTLSSQYLTTLSKVTLSADGGTPTLGSSIKSWTFTGQSINAIVNSTSASATAQSNVLTTAGEITYTITLTDGRGRKASKTITITAIEYKAPSISISVDRYSSATKQDDVGAFAKATIKGEFSAVSGNTYSIVVDYRKNDDEESDFTEVYTNSNLAITPFDFATNIFPASDTASWQIRATITDKAGASTSVVTILQTGSVIIDFRKGGKGISFGYSAIEDGFRIDGIPFMSDVINHLDGTDWFDDVIVEATIPNSSTEWKILKTEKGLAICWTRIFGSASITSTWGSIYTNATKPYATFPFSFIAEPTVFMSPSSVTGLNGDYWIGKVNMAQTATRSGDIGLWRATSATGVNYGVYILAIGRYK